MLAIIETGGKQYKVEEGQKINIEKIIGKEKGPIVFENVLMINDGKDIKVGNPFLAGANVKGEILSLNKDKKVKTVKHKSKKRYLVRKGHRQNILKVQIGKITA